MPDEDQKTQNLSEFVAQGYWELSVIPFHKLLYSQNCIKQKTLYEGDTSQAFCKGFHCLLLGILKLKKNVKFNVVFQVS